MSATAVDISSMIAEWVGAVGTAGALLLGVGLFYVDRRDRRRSQADQFNVTLSGRSVGPVTVSENAHAANGGGPTLVLTASNDSDSNIYRPVALIPRPDGKPGFGQLLLFNPETETAIGKRTTIVAERAVQSFDAIRTDAVVRFTDARNRTWWRHIESGKYLWGPRLWRAKAGRQFMSLAADLRKS